MLAGQKKLRHLETRISKHSTRTLKPSEASGAVFQIQALELGTHRAAFQNVVVKYDFAPQQIPRFECKCTCMPGRCLSRNSKLLNSGQLNMDRLLSPAAPLTTARALSSTPTSKEAAFIQTFLT